MAGSEKFGRMKQLMSAGKQKGYVLYDEVSELLPTELNGGADLDDLLTGLDVAGIEILEEPKLDPKIEEADEFLDLDLVPTPVGDKTNDPVRMYLREMGAVPLLTREQEVEICKRIEDAEVEAHAVAEAAAPPRARSLDGWLPCDAPGQCSQGSRRDHHRDRRRERRGCAALRVDERRLHRCQLGSLQ